MDFTAIRECRYTVIGDPVAHSRSPQMQNAGFEALGLGRPYGKLHVHPGELPEFAAYARRHLDGANLTVPHKEAIIPLLDDLSEGARLAHSVNTLSVIDGRLLGDSTDGYGLEGAVREAFGMTPGGAAVLFVGTGGAARAAAFHYALRGARRICLVNRTPERAEELAAGIRAAVPGVECAVAALADGGRVREFIAASELLVQATSCGLHPDDPAPFDPDWLAANPRLACFDTIYRETAFLKAAAQTHCTADGRWMLLHQGAKSLEIWTGKVAPLEAMRRALEASL